MLVETSRTLKDPSGKTLYEAWKATAAKEKEEGTQSSQMNDSGVADGQLADTRIGSGSDHTVFLNFVGMPVIGLQFDGDYGVYHSAYDDFYWMNHFGDPGYKYHTLMSQLWGVTALRLANSDLLPFDFASYASNIRQFVNDLADKNKSVILSEVTAPQSEAATQSKDPVPACSTCGVSGSSQRGFVSSSPTASSTTALLDLSGVRTAIDNFEAAGKTLNASLTEKLAAGPIDPKLAATLNHGMMQVERNWLNPDGIPGRPWFKHILYGARFTYAHLELPGLTEAVEAKDWPTAKKQAEILESALKTNTKLLQELNNTVNSR
jgi:N-acetylated-alpha-linked acidic dipeptidase